MIKYTILPFLIILLFTGCVDRGHHVVLPVQQGTIKTNTVDLKQTNNLQDVSSEVENVEATPGAMENGIDNEIQNNIAGILIIIIGIMIFI